MVASELFDPLKDSTDDESRDTLARVLEGLGYAQNYQARMNEIQRLRCLSDAELAELGVERQDIARYVFRDLLGPD
ncbi:MAG: DUF1127 domain-containing protein [Pseudomonadota bacterium]